MPLTRNLYELDEVTAALQLCLMKGWSRAIFWLCELVLSKEEETAQQILQDLWLRSGGHVDQPVLHYLPLPEQTQHRADGRRRDILDP